MQKDYDSYARSVKNDIGKGPINGGIDAIYEANKAAGAAVAQVAQSLAFWAIVEFGSSGGADDVFGNNYFSDGETAPGDEEGPSTRTIEFNGKTVYQDDNLFDPNAVDEMGRTNIKRMEQGLAPKGYDGQPVNIHHIDQTNDGPVMEISASEHQTNYGDLHENTGQSFSQINRNEFNRWGRNYWEWRADNFN